MRQKLEFQADRIEAVLALHKVPAQVTGGTVTPRWVRFQVLPQLGAKISRIKGLSEELAAALDASSCRVSRRGAALDVEVPRDDPQPVRLLPLYRQLASPPRPPQSPRMRGAGGGAGDRSPTLPPATAILGLAEDGAPLLIRLPSPDVAHVLVAGTTGSGKTVLLQAMILSLALTNLPPSPSVGRGAGGEGLPPSPSLGRGAGACPERSRRGEGLPPSPSLGRGAGACPERSRRGEGLPPSPSLGRGAGGEGLPPSPSFGRGAGGEGLTLVLIDPKRHAFSLFDGLPHLARPVIHEVDEASEALQSLVRLMERRVSCTPRIVVVIDELADLLMTGGQAVQWALTRLTQRGREAGIHVVAATQKPTAAILGPLVKANFPVRLVGRVTSIEDARTATGWSGTGAERLMGRGDFIAVAEGRVMHFQAAHVSAEEIREVVAYLAQREPAPLSGVSRTPLPWPHPLTRLAEVLAGGV